VRGWMGEAMRMAQQRERSARDVRILVVDGQPLWRTAAVECLSSIPRATVCGISVAEPDLVGEVERFGPDSLVLDIDLPEQGLDVLRRLVARRPGLRAVVVSTRPMPLMALVAFEIGALGFVLRCCSETELCDAVRAVTQGRSWCAPDLAGSLLDDFRVVSEASRARLTRRERLVVEGVKSGLSNGEIAAMLRLSKCTVQNYVSRVYRKLGVTSRNELVDAARWISSAPHVLPS